MHISKSCSPTGRCESRSQLADGRKHTRKWAASNQACATPDLVVHLGNGKLIVELKAISGELGAAEEQQLRNYMTILNVQRGLLINFQQPGRKQGKTKLHIRERAL